MGIINKESYVSPLCEVIEVTAHGVLCASGSNEDYSNTNPDWFN